MFLQFYCFSGLCCKVEGYSEVLGQRAVKLAKQNLERYLGTDARKACSTSKCFTGFGSIAVFQKS